MDPTQVLQLSNVLILYLFSTYVVVGIKELFVPFCFKTLNQLENQYVFWI